MASPRAATMSLLVFVVIAVGLQTTSAYKCPDPCVAKKTCIPTRKDYDAVTTVAPGVSFKPQPNRLNCTVPFALCAWANCKIIPKSQPPIAECGCVNGKKYNEWSVTVAAAIPVKAIIKELREQCYPDGFSGDNICPQNKDPFCAAVAKGTYLGGKWDTMSTFTPQSVETSLSCTGPGLVAVCDAAACYNKRAWDGSPVKCYCTYYKVPKGVVYDIDGFKGGKNVTCIPPKGYVHSGIVPVPE